MDVISIPIVFNTMRSKSGIYKLSCICDKNIDLTIGLTEEDNFNEKIYTHTYERCFWPEDITGINDLITLSNQKTYSSFSSSEGERTGELQISIDGHSSIEDVSIQDNDDDTNILTLIYDSYNYIIYLYQNNIKVDRLQLEYMGDNVVPFIYVYYSIHHKKSDCLVNIKNKTIKFA